MPDEVTENQLALLKITKSAGEMACLFRSVNWSESSLGPVISWPQPLRTTLNILFSSSFPMFLFWGPDHLCFYNDAYRPSLGNNGKHPQALGKPGEAVWPEIWSTIKPQIDMALQTEKATWFEDHLLPIFRNGSLEDVHWTYSYSPVYDEGGTPAGVFVACMETSRSVKAMEQLRNSEQRFQNLIRDVAAGIIVLKGTELKVEIINDAFCKFIGKKTSDLLDAPFFEKLPEAQLFFLPILSNVLKTGEQIHLDNQPFSIFGNTSAEAYLDLIFQPYKEAEGKISGVMIQCRDVTQQTREQNRIAFSEQNLRNVFAQAPLAMALFKGTALNVEIANGYAMEHFGIDPHAMPGTPLLNGLNNARVKDIAESLSYVYKSGKSFSLPGVEVPLQRRGLTELANINFTLEPYREMDGTVSGVMSVAAEVTEEVSARKKMEESQHRLRSLVESAPFPIGVYIGKEMKIQFANDAMLKSLNKDYQVVGLLYKSVVPEKSNQAIFGQLETVFESGLPFHAKYQVLDLLVEGKVQSYYFNYSLTPLRDSEGNIYGILHTAADVTDLATARKEIEKSEERFRIMADAAPNMVWSFRPDGSQRYLNKFGLEYLGLTLEEHIEKNWVPFIHPEDLDSTRDAAMGAIKARKPYSHEQRLLGKDGEYRWFISHGGPSYYPNGELYGYVGTSIDVTDLKLANDQLKRINNDLDNFIYTASHDLKAPMSNIEGLLNSLRDNLKTDHEITDDTGMILQFMEKSISRFKSTIQDLTDLTKVQKGQHETADDVDLMELLDDVKLSIRDKIIESGVRIEVDIAEAGVLKFSKRNLRSIIYNLLSNAIKYRDPSRSCEVLIQTSQLSNFVRLTVADNGLGIRKQGQDKLYTMFKRFHDHVEGSGIGLYIVKRIMDNAKGNIEVETEEGKGTSFHLYFRQ